ncbi:MAG: hypothetical protein AABW86_05615 [Candidatus Micrarchaeota archaeon]
MSGHALKRPEYLEPVFKRVFDKVDDKMDNDIVAKLSRDYALIIKKESDGSYTLTGLNRSSTKENPVYVEIHIDSKTSNEALKAFSKLTGKYHPTGATEIMRSLYAKFDRYNGIDAEEAKLITRAFLAVSQTTNEGEWRVAYQRTYFKKPTEKKEKDWELPLKIVKRGREKELNAEQQTLKSNVDKFLNDYRLASKSERSTSQVLSESYNNSGLLRIVIDDLNRAKTELPGVYKPKELNDAIKMYGYALVIVQGLELQEPDSKPQTKNEKHESGTVVPVLLKGEKKKPDDGQDAIIGKVHDYFDQMGLERGGKFTSENAKGLDSNVISIMLKNLKAVNKMFDEYKLPASLSKREIERVIGLLEDELNSRK